MMRMMIVTPVKRVPPLKPSGKAGRCADMYSNHDYHLPGSATATQSARLEFAEGILPGGNPGCFLAQLYVPLLFLYLS